MKKTLLLFITTTLLVTTGYAQITTTKVAKVSEASDNKPYDGTENYLGKDVQKYVGQELYLPGKSEGSRTYGYAGFYLDYNESTIANKANVYMCCDGYNSKYADLAGKYFKVLEVIKHPKADEEYGGYKDKFFFKLEEKDSKDIFYYMYDTSSHHTFPFVAVKYFNYLKKTAIGKKYVVKGRNWIDKTKPMLDMNTGKPVSDFVLGGVWKVVDVTIEELYYNLSLVLENKRGERIPIPIDNSKSMLWVFDYETAEAVKQLYGPKDWLKELSKM